MITIGCKAMGFIVLLGAMLGGAARAQDAALRDRVRQLSGRLVSGDVAARAEAEKGLIELGRPALPLLPESVDVKSAEAKESLERVRKALEEAGAELNLGASKITIQGEGIRLSEVIQELQKQTGNEVKDLREQFGQEASNPSMNLDLKDVGFFEALDRVCQEARVGLNFFTGDGSIGLVAQAMAMPGQEPPVEAAGKGKWISYNGPFRVQVVEISLKRDFQNGQNAANVRLEVAWEPRLRPMLLTLASKNVTIKDDRGDAVPPSLQEEETSVPLRADNPVVEANINMQAPDRAAKKLAEVKVKATVTIPSGTRTFTFPDLTKPEKRTQGKVVVELVSTEVDDFVWKVRLIVSQPGGEGPGYDSYQQGLFSNQIWLQRADGSRFEHNGGFSNLGSAEGKMGFEYLFVDAPGKPEDYRLVYEAPNEIVSLPLEIELSDVPLP